MKTVAFCMCCVLILTAPGVMAQQPTAPNHLPAVPTQSWDFLRQFQRGETIQVQRKIGRRAFVGEIVRYSDTELEIDSSGKILSFSRDEVKKVWYFAPPHRVRRIFDAILLGTGFFFLALVIGAGASSECGDCVGAVIGASVGVGAAAGSLSYFYRGKRRKLIYIAP